MKLLAKGPEHIKHSVSVSVYYGHEGEGSLWWAQSVLWLGAVSPSCNYLQAEKTASLISHFLSLAFRMVDVKRHENNNVSIYITLSLFPFFLRKHSGIIKLVAF